VDTLLLLVVYAALPPPTTLPAPLFHTVNHLPHPPQHHTAALAPMEIDTTPSLPLPPSSLSLSLPPRPDRRLANQLRPPLCELGPLNRADGSARFAQGRTSVLAAVYGPGAPRFSRKERIEGAAIEVTIHPHKGAGTSSDKEKEGVVKALLEAAILLDRFPRTMIHVICQVCEDDGGLLACLMNAAVLAVINAGIDMKYVPLAVSMVFASPPSSAAGAPASTPLPSSSTTYLLLDPLQEEEKEGAAVVTVAISSVDWNVLSCQSMGVMMPVQLFEAVEVARGATKALLAFVRMTIEEHSRQMLKLR